MKRPFLRVVVFTVASLAVYSSVVATLSDIAGERGRVEKEKARALGAAVEVTPQGGEEIFWSKCYTCHSVGSRGSAVRGPNQGETGPSGLPIGARAVKRAEERAKQTGKPYTPTDYLLESLVEPSAYLVEGFSNLMPPAWKPPIALKVDEIRAVVAYLQSLGGTVDVAAVDKSPFMGQLKTIAASGKAQASTDAGPKLLMAGHPEAGKELFFDPESSAGCAKCHTVKDKGGKVGPELTNIAAMQPLEYIIESILQPSKVTVKGYEPVLLKMKDGRFVTGVIKKEGADFIEIGDSQGQIQKISKGEVAERVPQKTSLMPGNFAEVLPIKDFYDLLAFLQTLK